MFLISRVCHYPEAPSKCYWHPESGGSNWDGLRRKGCWRKLTNGKRNLSSIPVKCYYTKAAAKAVMTRNGWKDSSHTTFAIEEI